MAITSDAEMEIFTKSLGSINERFSGFESSLESMRKKTELAAQGIKDDTDLAKSYSRLMRDRKDREKELLDAQKKGKTTAEETRASLKLLNEQTKSAVPPEFRKSADAYITAQEQITNGTIATNEILNGKFVKSISVAASGLTSFAGGMLKSYQGTSNGLDMALDTATMAVNAAGSGMSAVGKGLMSAAPGLLALGPEMAPVVVGLEILGSVLNAAAAATEAVGKAMPFMNKEVQMVSSAFKTASNAGALFADGFTGLKNAAAESGLDAQTFSNAIKDNKEALTLLGGSVTSGAKRIGSITKSIDVDSLQKLGFGLEEIPGLIATVGSQIARSGKTMDDKQLAQATADYAKNLRLIADFSGEDAKTLEAKADAQMKDLAFQQVMSGKSADEQIAIRQSMQSLPPAVQEMVKEMVVSGGNLTGETTNIMAQQIPGFKKAADDVVDQLNRNVLTSKSGGDAMAKFGEEALGQLKGATDLAKAAAITKDSALESVAAQAMESWNLTLKYAKPDEWKKLAETVDTASKTADPKTEELAKLERQGMEQRVKLQNITVASLDAYMTALTTINKATLEFAKGFSDVVDTMTGNKASKEQSKVAETAAKGEAIDNTTKKGIFTMFGLGTTDQDRAKDTITDMSMDKIEALAKANQTTVDAISKTIGLVDTSSLEKAIAAKEEQRQMETDAMTYMFQGADGGVPTGPTTGYPALLHGTEAVIPLPSGVNGETFTNMLKSSIDATNKKGDSKDSSVVTSLIRNSQIMGQTIGEVSKQISQPRESSMSAADIQAFRESSVKSTPDYNPNTANEAVKIQPDSFSMLTGTIATTFSPLTSGVLSLSSDVKNLNSTMIDFAKSTIATVRSYIESANSAFDPLVKKDSDTASTFDSIKAQITRFVDIVPTLAPKVTPDENAVDPMTYGATQITDAISSMMVANNPTDGIASLITQNKEQAAAVQDQVSKIITDSAGINSGDISTLLGNMSGNIGDLIKELIASSSTATDASTALLLQQMPGLADALTNAVTPMSDGMSSLNKSVLEQGNTITDFAKSNSVTGDMFNKFVDSAQTNQNANNESTISGYIDSINHIFDPFVQKNADDTVPQNPDTTISDNISSFGSDLSSLSNTLIEQFSKLLENNTGTKESMDSLVTKVTPVEELMVREPRTDELLEILNRQMAELISLTSSVVNHTETTSLRIM